MKRLRLIFIIFLSLLALNSMAQNKDASTALLIIDIQDFYFPGGDLPLKEPGKAAANASLLADHFRNNGMPVIYIKHNYEPGGSINILVKPAPGDMIFTKDKANSFVGTGLEDYLRKQHIDTLVICGMQTQMCVEATTRAASDLGFTCILVEDACTTRDLNYNNYVIRAADVHYSTLATLKSYASVVTTSEYLESVKGSN